MRPTPLKPCQSHGLIWAFIVIHFCLTFTQTSQARDLEPTWIAAIQIPITGSDIIISHGTRRAQNSHTAPYAVTVLTNDDLNATNPRTLPEALDGQTGVLIQKTASGHGSPYIRGFTGNRTLAVIDGIRYNNASYRDGPNEYFSHIDVFTLGQIELLRGPASTLYGSQAVGGTISLRTKPSIFNALDNKDYGQFFWRASQTLRASSGDHSLVSRSEFDIGRAEKWGLKLGASIKDYGDVRAASLGRLPKTGYTETGFDARLDAQITGDLSASFVHQSTAQDDVWRTHSTIYSVPFMTDTGQTFAGTDRVRTKDQARALTALHLSADSPVTGIQKVKISAAHQPRVERERRITQSGKIIDQGFDSDLWSLSAVLHSRLSPFSSRRSLGLTYGFDLSAEFLNSDRTDTDPLTGMKTFRIQGPIGDEARYRQAGGFITAEQDFTVHNHNIHLELGGRASYIRATIERFEDPFTHQITRYDKAWSNLSGSIRASTDINPSTQIWASANTAFRAPNIADISRFGRSRSTEIEIASLNLRPETFKSLELGLRWTGPRHRLSLSGYLTDLADYIDTVATGRILDGLTEVAKQNAASGRVSGVEIEGEFFVTENLRLRANATYLEGNLQNADGASEPLSRLMPLSLNVGLEWKTGDAHPFGSTVRKPWARLNLSFKDRADRLSSGDFADVQRIPTGGTPAYVLLSISAGTNIGDTVRLSLHANNLLDSAYRSHGSGSNEPGRHIMASLHYEFGS